MAALDNANPTILSESELATHRQRRRNRGDGPKKSGIRELLMAKPSYSLDPFYLSDFSDTDSDDSSVEPIDEQEIYGTLFPLRNDVVFGFRCQSFPPMFKIML